jgi:DNA-binding IclR family transcriptional regulator
VRDADDGEELVCSRSTPARTPRWPPPARYGTWTGETITDAAALRAELDAVAGTGIAIEVQEAVLGECAAAAPLVDATGGTPGAISLVLPATRWPLDPSARHAPRDTARTVSRELGAPAWPPAPGR